MARIGGGRRVQVRIVLLAGRESATRQTLRAGIRAPPPKKPHPTVSRCLKQFVAVLLVSHDTLPYHTIPYHTMGVLPSTQPVVWYGGYVWL